MTRVVLADYGAGNLRSVASAFVRAGASVVASAMPGEVAEAPLVVVAGVGNAAAAGRGLERAGLDEALRERAARGRPLLGICVGMQLLFDESEEGGRGLALLRGRVERVRARRVPHMGWNTLRVVRPSALLDGVDGADVYFAHSFACAPEDGVTSATVEHGGGIVAAVEHGGVAGVQFHPERSGRVGARVIENVLRWSNGA